MENDMRKWIDQVRNFGKSLNENKDGINYRSIDLGNETERKIDDIVQAVYWSGGDIEKVYDEWNNLNLDGIEYNNKSIHFLNYLKSKFPKYSNIEKPTSNESDTVKEINKLLQLIKDIQGSSEVSRLYDEYAKIERPTNYEYNNENDAINFLNWLKQKKNIK